MNYTISSATLKKLIEKQQPCTFEELYDIIDNMPDIIIRCQDCKHYRHRCCHLFDGLTLPMPDDYCSYAERKEEK